MVESVLAVDPGRSKCGIAVVSRSDGLVAKTIVSLTDLPNTARLLASRFKPCVVVVGGGTGARRVLEILADLPLPVQVVDERMTTQKARASYFKDNPPKGWRKLLPLSLQAPPEPYDDYAAALLAEQFLANAECGVRSAE